MLDVVGKSNVSGAQELLAWLPLLEALGRRRGGTGRRAETEESPEDDSKGN